MTNLRMYHVHEGYNENWIKHLAIDLRLTKEDNELASNKRRARLHNCFKLYNSLPGVD